MINQNKKYKHELVMLKTGVPWSFYLLFTDVIQMEKVLFEQLYSSKDNSIISNKETKDSTNLNGFFIDTDYKKLKICAGSITDIKNYMTVGNKFKIRYYIEDEIDEINDKGSDIKIYSNIIDNTVLTKHFTVVKLIKDIKSKHISLFITEERITGKKKIKLQYELNYSIYLVNKHSVLIKIEILFHPSIKMDPIFTENIKKDVSESINNEMKNEKYEYSKVEESVIIKSSRPTIMNIINNFDKLDNSDIIYSRANKSSDCIDEIGDRYSFYQKSVSSYIELQITNVEYPESIYESYLKESEVIKSEPEIVKYKHKTELIAINEKKTLFNFSYKFQKQINFKKLALFRQDIRNFLYFVKGSLSKSSKCNKDKYV